MNVRFEFRRRTNVSDDVEVLHNRLVRGLSRLSRDWWNPDAPVEDPDFGNGLEAQVNLGLALAARLSGYVAYVYRSPTYTGLTAEFDDRLILDADFDQQSYARFQSSAFPIIISAFRPYRAEVILDEDLALDDWEAESGKGLTRRDGVVRIAPVSYWDEELCTRAFNRTPSRLVEALRNHVASVVLSEGGVLLVATSAILSRTQLVTLDQELRMVIETNSAPS